MGASLGGLADMKGNKQMSVEEFQGYLLGDGSIVGSCAGKGSIEFSLWLMKGRLAFGSKKNGERFSLADFIELADILAA
jgi:hypothetical protein